MCDTNNNPTGKIGNNYGFINFDAFKLFKE